MQRKRIAVIGAGITGLSAAWLLSSRHDVTLIEAQPRLGGHSNTVDTACSDGICPVDTGFIVYNTQSYPNLIALFDHLGVATAPTSMSFAVSLAGGRYEYSGSGLTGLFGQPANLLRPSHWRMTADILRFFKQAAALGLAQTDERVSLGAWLHENGYSDAFISRHIVPMGAAIWSTPADEMLAFPAAAFARFFANHGLLTTSGPPLWRTVRGGSRAYVDRLAAAFAGQTITADPAVAVLRDGKGVDDGPGRATDNVTARADVEIVLASGRRIVADACLLACHADEALALIDQPDDDERALLAPFRYARNEAVLHVDPAWMPRRRRLWSSWNYVARGDGALSLTYWMNSLQPLATRQDVFVTLNPEGEIAAGAERGRFVYHHPMFDAPAMSAQRRLWSLQGRRRTWFAGSYFGYGFHEDGIQAGLAAAEAMGGVRRPWTVVNESSRVLSGVGQPAGDAAAAKPEPALRAAQPADVGVA